MEIPYLSIVLVARNDGHSANMLRRIQICVGSVVEQMERYKIHSELILVEWIPPNDTERIKDLFPWPNNLYYCTIRNIVVPASSIGKYQWSEDYSVRDSSPWNVGVRRARGEFVLALTIDVLFSNELMSFFAEKKLDKTKFYRINRYDVKIKVMDLTSVDERLTYCKNNIVDMYAPYPLEYFIKKKIIKKKLPLLHNYAPGDFMLFSKEKWILIRGFPEGLSIGADNTLLYMVYLAGAKEYVFKNPMRLYHIDHKSRWQTPLYMLLRRFFYRTKLPYPFTAILALVVSKLSHSKSYLGVNNFKLLKREEIYQLILDMVEGKRSYIYNDENWGLRGQQLVEYILSGNNKTLNKSNML